MTDLVAQLVGALEECKKWHQGDRWRDGTSTQRTAWETHRDMIDAALKSAQPAEVSDEDDDDFADKFDAWIETIKVAHDKPSRATLLELIEQMEAARAILALRPQAVPMTEWQPLDAARLNSEEFDGAYWLAMKNGVVSVGEYEWRQGWNPHGFNLIEGGRVGPSDVTHTARFTRPVHPSHGITAQGAQGGEG